MELIRKHGRRISFIFHMSMYFGMWFLYHEVGSKNIAFAVIFIFNLLNYVSSIANFDFYTRTLNIVDHREKTITELRELNNRLNNANKMMRSKHGIS